MGKKTNLKAALSNHQEKQRKAQLQKVREAAKKEATKTSAGRSGKARGKQRPHTQNFTTRSTIPVSSSDTILLVGEGNFSFARALFDSDHPSLAFLPPENVIATTYDAEEVCYEKYPDAKDIVLALREKGVAVLFGVDARRLDTYKQLRRRKWQRVIWNFPHAGKGISDQDRNILSNQILILDFLKSVAPLLKEGRIPCLASSRDREKQQDTADEGGGESGDEIDSHSKDRAFGVEERGTVLITLRNAPPYSLWDLSSLAKKPPLTPHPSSYSPSFPYRRYGQLRSFWFRRRDWKGYEHRMTKGWNESLMEDATKIKDEESRTWEFYLQD